MQVCTLLQTNNHASTPPLSFFAGRMPFLPPNQQCQSTKGKSTEGNGMQIGYGNKPINIKITKSLNYNKIDAEKYIIY